MNMAERLEGVADQEIYQKKNFCCGYLPLLVKSASAARRKE